MAVVIPFVAFYTYNLISNGTVITSRRRTIAAALAGWASLTTAAAVTAFEFGIQPILHHSAEGVPLYMPYSLGVTLPAMILEHAFGFSILEALITALIFSYIQRTDTSLFYGERSLARENKRKKTAST
jgi:cobalt/nickel transport system permease protein